MSDVWLGTFALLAGLLFTFRGGSAMRVIIAVWGAFVGFSVGAALVAYITGQELLAGPPGWIGAVLGALLFAWLAYAFYAIAVIIGVGSVGFGLGMTASLALGASEGLGTVIGVVCAVLLALIALAAGVPHLLLVVVSALGGASAAVAGVMLLVGAATSADFAGPAAADVVVVQWWWSLAWVVLAVAGIIVQSRARRPADARSAWARDRRS
ncbi:MAG TPA: hypothetical protein VFC82_08680 [Actinomycetaceae bacterium]|nr:hypothetical protein [Actinomycetaceae bacterium]